MRATLPPWAEFLAVFDTETTGVSPSKSRIVTACCAVIDGSGRPIERYDWMIDPGVDIPDVAVRIHGVTTELARTQGLRAEHGIRKIIAQLEDVLARGLPLTVYNAPFDLSMLAHEANRYGIPFDTALSPVLDPLIIDRQCDRYRRGKRTLTAVAQHYGVTLEQAHDAGADAIAAGQVMQEIARRYGSSLPADVAALHEDQVGWALGQAENFQAYMRTHRDPAFVADGRWPVNSSVFALQSSASSRR